MDEGNRERYSTNDGWTCANASETFCGTELESLGVEAEVGAPGDCSRGGVSGSVLPPGEVTELVEDCLVRLRVSSLDDMTRVCPPKMANRDADISASGPMLS